MNRKSIMFFNISKSHSTTYTFRKNYINLDYNIGGTTISHYDKSVTDLSFVFSLT